MWFFANNIIRTSRLLLNHSLRPLGLSSAEGNVLLEMLTGGDGLLQEQLVEKLDISKSAVSRALDSLERKAYVVRHHHPSDRRGRLVFLTLRAQRLGPHLERVYEDLFDAASRDIDDREIAQFTDLFRRVSDNLTQARQECRMPTEDCPDVD